MDAISFKATYMKAIPLKIIATSLLLVIGLMALSAYAGSHDEQHADEHGHNDNDRHNDEANHVSELEGLRALHGWTNATRDANAHVYVELENTGSETITLTGAHAGIAESALLTGFRLAGGEPQHEPIAAMPLDPASTLVLSPNGLSILLNGLTASLAEGDDFLLHLDTDAGRLDVHVKVESANARQHSHAGHAH